MLIIQNLQIGEIDLKDYKQNIDESLIVYRMKAEGSFNWVLDF
ncbi:MAG: hypothetical protein RIR48_3153 [Bacteroidota bacterium]|jgi:hypothetical protein